MRSRVSLGLTVRRPGFAAISALAATALLAAAAQSASAATLTVTTTADELTANDGQCSLREAVAAVNSPGTATDCGTADSTSNTIVLPAGTYALSIPPSGADDNSSGDLNVTGTTPLTITGAGASASVIDATGLGDRVLSIATGASVTLRRLEITGGLAPYGAWGRPCSPPFNSVPAGPGGNGANGGGIDNAGTLSLIGVAVAGNTAGVGGRGGSCISLTNPLHRPAGRGGSGGSGGGIYSVGALNVTRSAILNNSAGSGRASGAGSPLAAGGSGGSGGGIYAGGGSLQVTNSTLAGNNAGEGGGGNPNSPDSRGGGDGGAIAATGLTRAGLVQNATVADNAAGAGGSGRGGHGGGLAIATEKLTLQNTIVASNNANGAANCWGVIDGGHDLSYPDASCPGANGNPALQPLADYGGPTQTMALGPGSAALDQVPATGAGCPATDQRGVKRPQGPACDIGAFEFATPAVTITTPRRRANYAQGAHVVAAYTCSEGGITSPIASTNGCAGTVPNGQPIDTSTPGTHSFTVTATDKAGNTTTQTHHYTVS